MTTTRLLVGFTLLIAACASTPDAAAPVTTTTSSTIEISPTTAVPGSTTPDTDTVAPTTIVERTGTDRPDWLGTRLLPLRPGEDNGVAQPTPDELLDRRLWTIDYLAPPADMSFHSRTETPVPADVLARSTWTPECPVESSELAYAQVVFIGFDGLAHTGEFIAHVEEIDDLVTVFAELHAMRFPIEQMQVTSQEALDAHPTGDGNNTSAFVCRPAVNSANWSRHAMGRAIDLNPFHNPYLRADLVIPELASAYLDRDDQRVGMVTSEVVARFEDIGWGWGGTWTSAQDWMHFSDNGH